MSKSVLAVLAGLTVALLAGCSASTTTDTPTPTTAQTAQPTPTPTPIPTPTATPAPAAVDLSGSWSGTYSGPFTGSFTLTWTQSGSSLDGTIHLSSPADTLHINGTVTGSAIGFGAVGVVTYSGTVSGSSMSGSYIDVANGQSGSWSAGKS
jgi:glucose/arabinose dehydrogenase